MVGYKPEANVCVERNVHAMAGGISGVATRAVCQPLDVLKIRFQLQVEPITHCKGSKYQSILQAIQLIYKEEGISSFWKGHVPAQYLSLVFGVVQFYSFEELSYLASKSLPSNLYRDDKRALVHSVCGSIAGGIATTVSFPFDVIRTRFVAQGNVKVYHSIFGGAKSIWTNDGIFGFYRGLLPAILQSAPYSGLQFGFYTLFVYWWHLFSATKEGSFDPAGVSLASGALAGTCAKFTVYPLDLLKKRLQIQGFGHARSSFGSTHVYSGLWQCTLGILKQEGATGFYKGIYPSLLKAMASTGCGFLFFEQSKRAIHWLTN